MQWENISIRHFLKIFYLKGQGGHRCLLKLMSAVRLRTCNRTATRTGCGGAEQHDGDGEAAADDCSDPDS